MASSIAAAVLRRRQGEGRAPAVRDGLPGRSNAHSVRGRARYSVKYRHRDHRAASALKAIASWPFEGTRTPD